MREWKHITTAPRDGTRVRITTLTGRVVEAAFVNCQWKDDDEMVVRAPMYWAEIKQSEEV